MYVCVCEAVTDNEIKAEISLGARTVEEISARNGAGSCCGMCHDKIRALLPLNPAVVSEAISVRS